MEAEICGGGGRKLSVRFKRAQEAQELVGRDAIPTRHSDFGLRPFGFRPSAFGLELHLAALSLLVVATKPQRLVVPRRIILSMVKAGLA
jgi:hypothetical protein